MTVRFSEKEFRRLRGELSGPGDAAVGSSARAEGSSSPGPLSSRKAPREAAWAGYELEVRLCARCGGRVTLGQALQAHTEIEDGRVGSRWVRHLAAVDCEGLR